MKCNLNLMPIHFICALSHYRSEQPMHYIDAQRQEFIIPMKGD